MSTVADGEVAGRGDLDELRTSARGWHGVQLAVLGFIGLCGALQSGAASTEPRWLQVLAAVLVLAALAIACLATVLVAGAAWPVGGWRRTATADDGSGEEVQRGGRHLRTGIVLTFVAVGLVALATSSSWWPTKESAAAGWSRCPPRRARCAAPWSSRTTARWRSRSADSAWCCRMQQVAGVRPAASC